MRIESRGAFSIKDIPYGVGWWWQGSETRMYEGTLTLYIEDGRLLAVLHLPLEEYVKGVIPYEIGVDTPIEALKAQALAARTEVVKALKTGKYKGRYYDLCADVECQVFAGNHKRTARTDSAVTLTKGEVLIESETLIDAYFASNCGGMSEVVEKVWPWRGGPKPYLIAHFDGNSQATINPQRDIHAWLSSSPNVYCNPDFIPELPAWSKKHFRWNRTLTEKDFSEDFRSVDSIKVKERGASGRIHQLIVWQKGVQTLLNYELAVRKIANIPLRSSAFSFTKTEQGSWQLEGAGWGHGVGLCQSGAVGRALSGHSYTDVLDHYYPGTSIIRSY
jgi:SpoIID/LytB domain protein